MLAALPKAPSRYNPYKFPEIGKFRRNLVLSNLLDNGFINKNEYEKFKNLELNLKKEKIEIVNEANSYTEEVRRAVKEKYGFEKLYSQGLSIRTPLNIEYQIQAIKSLEKVLKITIEGMAGEEQLQISFKIKIGKKKIKKFKLDPTLKMEIAEISNLNENKLILQILIKILKR